MKNKILFIGATHGDEPIGINVLKSLSKTRDDFNWIIGNKPAYRINKREFEGDLNRSAPGNINSKRYAIKRAAEILKLSKNFKYTIDIHGTSSNSGIFIIVTNPSKKNLKLASLFSIKNIIIWPSFSKDLKGPLSEFFSCGIEIECGLKDKKETEIKLQKIIKNFLNKNESPDRNHEKQERYQVYDALLRNETKKQLCDFNKTTINNETFYPLLVNAYDSNVLCYKMKKLS